MLAPLTGVTVLLGASDELERYESSASSDYLYRLRLCGFHGLQSRGQIVIDPTSIAAIVGAVFGCWAAGFGAGKLVAWTRHLSNVA